MNLPPRRVKGVGLNLGEQNLHHADNWLTTAAPREPKVIDKLAKPRGHPGSPTHSFRISTTSGHPLLLGPAEPPASGRFFGLAVQAIASRSTSAAMDAAKIVD